MAIDGTYGFVYCGKMGPGFGVFTIEAGQVHGTDSGGVKYKGTAKRASDGGIEVHIQLTVPTGVSLVDGTNAEAMSFARHIDQVFPDGFGNGEPQKLKNENDTIIHVMIQRIEDRFSPSADSFTVNLPITS